MAFSLSSLFSQEPTSVLGIDIGTSSIKLVQLKRDRGRVLLETYGAISLGPYAGVEIGRATSLPADKIAEALKDVIREANVTTTSAAMSIPYSSSLISILKLPRPSKSSLPKSYPLRRASIFLCPSTK
jgi:type IV pilus assembly protein PilM